MSKPDVQLIQTADGSSSLYRPDLDETYHSRHGARGESEHIFIHHGLASLDRPILRIFEVGMGTGLNVFLTALYARDMRQKITLHTIEPLPVDPDLSDQLNYAQSDEERSLLSSIHRCKWDQPTSLNAYCQMVKSQVTLENTPVEPSNYDIVYFDAFAPSRQPAIWARENLSRCYEILDTGGILTTYCAQGQFKRDLRAVGFEVESLPGAMGKKEMVRARKTG